MKLNFFFVLALVLLIFVAIAHDHDHDHDHDHNHEHEHEPHYKDGKHNPEHQHSDNEVDEHRKDFDTYDLNKDGVLDAQEIREAINGVSDTELNDFFEATDNDQSGTVDFQEYLKAALEVIDENEEESHANPEGVDEGKKEEI